MVTINFIDANYVKTNSIIQQNVDDSLISSTIKKTQNIKIQQVLGDKFYEYLNLAIINGTLNADEEKLLKEYINTCLLEWTVYNIIPYINFKLSNTSVIKQAGDNAQSSGLDELQYLRNDIKSMANFYEERLIKYLNNNEDLFPVYKEENCGCSNINCTDDCNLTPKRTAYRNSGIYIPKHKKNNSYGNRNGHLRNDRYYE